MRWPYIAKSPHSCTHHVLEIYIKQNNRLVITWRFLEAEKAAPA